MQLVLTAKCYKKQKDPSVLNKPLSDSFIATPHPRIVHAVNIFAVFMLVSIFPATKQTIHSSLTSSLFLPVDAVEMLASSDDTSVNKGVEQSNATPLHYAVQGGHEECVQLLIEWGSNVNAITLSEVTCMHAGMLLLFKLHVYQLLHEPVSSFISLRTSLSPSLPPFSQSCYIMFSPLPFPLFILLCSSLLLSSLISSFHSLPLFPFTG